MAECWLPRMLSPKKDVLAERGLRSRNLFARHTAFLWDFGAKIGGKSGPGLFRIMVFQEITLHYLQTQNWEFY
jgi:hypothetical protein